MNRESRNGLGLITRGYSGVGVEQVSQMVFDEAELAKLRKNAPDFKESYDMGEFRSYSLQKGDKLSLGSDESQRCPNIWLEDKYLPGLKATSQEFMAEGEFSHSFLQPYGAKFRRSKTSDADFESISSWYARSSTWFLRGIS